jgi:chromosome segregation ATPase
MSHLADNGLGHPGLGGKPRPEAGPDELLELEHLRSENTQLRSLCIELEQALQEAAQHEGGPADWDERVKEYEALLEEKSDMIRQLHQQLHDAQTVVADLEGQIQSPQHRSRTGPLPREEELLALSEELEQERRQLQEDEQTLMEQMRTMEVTMAKERADMARQRNDLQRLQSEIRHEIERLERNGALQSKIDNLKGKLTDASTRRGLAPSSSGTSAQQQSAQPPPLPEKKKENSLFGRLFGR